MELSLPHSFFSNWHNKDENVFHENFQLDFAKICSSLQYLIFVTATWKNTSHNVDHVYVIKITHFELIFTWGHWFKYFFSDARAHFKLWTKIILKFWNDKLNNESYTLDWSMRATGVSRHSPLSQVVGSLIYNLRWEKKNQLLIKFKLSLVKIAILIYRVYILGTVH